MLYEQARSAGLAGLLSNQPEQPLFPPRKNRASWEKLSDELTRSWIAFAEEYLDYPWPALKMSVYLLLKRKGDSFTGWQAFCERRAILGAFLLAECMEGKGRFLDQIINGIYAISEETSWVQTLNMREKNFALPDEADNYVDLCSSETAQLFGWICALVGEELDQEDTGIRQRMEQEVLRRVIKPYLDRDDYWWMGFTPTRINNWNPWCNMNIIQTCACMGFPPELKAAVLEKLCRSLDVYIERYSDDGACDEGPMYWGAAGMGLGKCVELLKWLTHGAVDGSGLEKLQKIGAYFAKVHIHDDWFVDYADGDAKVPVEPGVYRLGKFLKNDALTALGRYAKPGRPDVHSWFQTYDHLAGLFDAEERQSAPAKAPYLEKAWFDVCEVLCAREQEGSEKGFSLSAKGGSNIESHNHNDIGNFILFLGGKPLFIDLGTEDYSLKTFSAERFSLWYLQSQYHNCPTIAGVLQHDGGEYFARDTRYEDGGSEDRIQLDIAPAYPEEAKAEKWLRSIQLSRGECPKVLVTDDWKASGSGVTSYNFMSQAEPFLNGNGKVEYHCGEGSDAVLEYDGEALEAVVERIPLRDARLRRNWGEAVYRLVLKEKQPGILGAKRQFIVQRIG